MFLTTLYKSQQTNKLAGMCSLKPNACLRLLAPSPNRNIKVLTVQSRVSLAVLSMPIESAIDHLAMNSLWPQHHMPSRRQRRHFPPTASDTVRLMRFYLHCWEVCRIVLLIAVDVRATDVVRARVSVYITARWRAIFSRLIIFYFLLMPRVQCKP